MKRLGLFLVVLLCLSLLSFLPLGKSQEKTYLKVFVAYGTSLKIPTISLSDSVVSYQDTKNFFQFNITLSKPPASNMFSFPIETAGLEFYYQPPLDQELDLKQYAFVNATHALNEKGEVIVYRPENVVGSYAVCMTNPKANMTGKLCHIYTPLIIDAKGNRVWGQLEVTKTSLTITVDEKWLAIANYPIVVDPTFGYTSIGATTDGVPANNLLGSKFTMLESGDITQISAYLGLANGAKAKVAIYSDVSGVPTALLASSSNEVTGDGNWQWQNFTISYAGVGGTVYWLIINNEQYDATLLRYDSGASNQWQFATNTEVYGTFPAVYPTPQYFNLVQSIYATYTTGGASPYYYTCTPSDTVSATTTFSAIKTIQSSATSTIIITIENGAVKKIFAQVTLTAQADTTNSLMKRIYTLLSNAVTPSIERYATKNLYSGISLLMYPLTEGSSWKIIHNSFSATSTATATIAITKTIYAVTVEIFETALLSAIAYCTKSIGLTILDIALWDTATPLSQLFAIYPSIVLPLTAEEAAAIGIAMSIIVLAICVGLIYARRRGSRSDENNNLTF